MRSDIEEEIERLALRFRQQIGIEDSQVWIDATTLLFKMHHYFNVEYLRVANEALPPPGGRWSSEKQLIEITEAVFVGAGDPNPDPRCRFTITHEIAHAFFDDQGVRNRSVKDSHEKQFSLRIRVIETRTDRFAVAVLAPLHLIQDNESAESIALRFGLSKTAAEIRAQEAQRTYRKKNRLPREIPPSVKAIIDDLKKPKPKK